jgi:hypothetical protein
VSGDGREPREQERTVVISAAAVPPAIARQLEAKAGTPLGPLPEAWVEVTPRGLTVTAGLMAQVNAWREAERLRTAESSPQQAVQSTTERSPASKPLGYERELWEQGISGPERGREPE